MKVKKKIDVIICDFCNKQEDINVAMYKCIKCGADFCSDCGEYYSSELGNYEKKHPQIANVSFCKRCIAELFKIPEERL